MTDTSRLGFNLYLVTDRKQTGGRNISEVVEGALRGGVRGVQPRAQDLSSREMHELSYGLRKRAARSDAKLIIPGRIDIGLAVAADGVQLGENSVPICRARRVLGDKKLIGVSCHNQVNAIIAQEKGADFITFGPVFFT